MSNARAELVDRSDHRAGMLGRDAGMNAVAEIEHVAVAATVAREHARHLFANSSAARRTGTFGSRLPCSATLSLDRAARIREIRRPVDAQRIATGLRHGVAATRRRPS